jgi:hypothetical protein
VPNESRGNSAEIWVHRRTNKAPTSLLMRKELYIMQMVRRSFNIQSISKQIFESRYNYNSKTRHHSFTLVGCLFTRPIEASIP